MSKTRLVWITPEAEKLIAYCARVSSSNQENPDYGKLLAYLIKHKHWSPFEMASVCVEVETSRAIAAQILRHRSFSFQEFSQRYAPVTGDSFEYTLGRKQAEKNRQSSVEALDEDQQKAWRSLQEYIQLITNDAYDEALELGVSREQARFLLPSATKTRLYMVGTIRSWLHYLEIRTAEETQAEHREIALAIRAYLIRELPTVSKVMGWVTEE